MNTNTKNICLATVATDDFVPGTLVMVHSFLKHNPWFQGNILIIHNGLAENHTNVIHTCFDNVHFVSISSRLKACLGKLISSRPDIKPRQGRFYSLEIFRLQGYDKVLFCDSDMLFRNSVHELLELNQALMCCGDGPYYRGNYRDRISFAEVSEFDPNRTMEKTFSSGFLLVDGKFLTEEHYARMLALFDDEIWRRIETPHTDQVIYNVYFDGKQHLVSCTYNYMLLHRPILYQRETVSLTDARVFHFNLASKPWQTKHVLEYVNRDGAFIQALQFWYDEYINALKSFHFRSKFHHYLF